MRTNRWVRAVALMTAFVALVACDRRERLVPTATGPWAGDVTGVVTDLASGANLSQACVTARRGGQLVAGAVTTADGRFTLPTHDIGTYEVTARRSGYASTTRDVYAAEDDGATADFELTVDPESTLGVNDGQWTTGTVDADQFPVELTVRCGMVTQFTVVVHPTNRPECTATFGVTPFVELSAGAFGFSLTGAQSAQGGVLTTRIDGSFMSSGGSVSLGISSFRIPCGVNTTVGAGLAQTHPIARAGS